MSVTITSETSPGAKKNNRNQYLVLIVLIFFLSYHNKSEFRCQFIFQNRIKSNIYGYQVMMLIHTSSGQRLWELNKIIIP